MFARGNDQAGAARPAGAGWLTGPAARVAGGYALFGFTWVLLSDRLLELVVGDPARVNALQTYKGWVFIAITAALVFALVQRHQTSVLRALEAETDSHRRLRDFAESAADWFWEQDAELRFTYISARLQEVFGMPVGHFIGRTREEAAGAASMGGDWEQLRECIAARREFIRLRYTVDLGTGGQRHCEISGRPLFDAAGRFHGYRGTGSHVTELVERERALAESERKLHVAQRVAGLGTWEVDLATGARTWSPELRRILGVDPGTLAPGIAGFETLVDGLDRARYRAAYERTARDGVAMDEEVRMLRPDGRPIIIHEQAELVRDDRGAPVKLVGTVRDATERHRIQARLRQAQKMEAVGQLTGGIAHDFNNLLSIILGNLQLIQRLSAGNEAVSGHLNSAMQASLRGADLTRRLLAFSRRQVLQPEVMEVASLFEGMRELLERTLGEHIVLRVDCAPGAWPVCADPGQLENALLNLAINARDALPAGGNLRVTVDNVSLDAAAAAQIDGDLGAGDYLCIVVRDDGEGMSAAVRERALEPYFTTKDIGRGSGLGLSMVSGFVAQSGGALSIDSAPGAGTAVVLYLPRQERVPDTPATGYQPPAAGTGQRGGGETLLVVEDQAAVRATAVALLNGIGYRVLEASDGPAALAALARHPEVELLFTDISMPGGMDGVALAREARVRQPAIKVLFTSGCARGALGEADEQPDDADLLCKPYLGEELAQRVRRLLDEPALA